MPKLKTILILTFGFLLGDFIAVLRTNYKIEQVRKTAAVNLADEKYESFVRGMKFHQRVEARMKREAAEAAANATSKED